MVSHADGEPLADAAALINRIRATSPGAQLVLTVRRHRSTERVPLVLGVKPE